MQTAVKISVALDTLAFSKKLRNTGMEPHLADALAEAINEVLTEFQNRHLFDL
jgi:hypothetical protein